MGRLFRLVFWLAGAWALGLMIFISTVPAANENQARFSNTDLSNPGNVGVVAYTGGRGTRIAEAMRLFQRGIGTRMLISGVHRDTTANDLKKLWNATRCDLPFASIWDRRHRPPKAMQKN